MPNSQLPTAKHRELTPREFLALEIIYKGIKVSREALSIALFKTVGRGALEQAEQTADQLWDFGMVINLGEFEDYRYTTTEYGETYYEEAKRPVREAHFKSQ